MQRKRLLLAVWLLAVAAMYYTVTWPLVASNSRYFYQEDDAHHFNHTVEMAQEGRLNPHYFNKPALHFYLRMPVVYASAAWEKMAGRLSSLREVRTRNQFGIGTYAFTPSHPNILLWNRLESVSWAIAIGALVFLITLRLTSQTTAAFLATALTLGSPEFLKNSYIIGVDTLMALLCVGCTALALANCSMRARSQLCASSLLAGLACAAKYNAAPIAIVPLSLWAMRDRSLRSLLALSLAGLAGFLLGAPFSVLAFDEFWAGISYELWHYAVAGHAGHSSEPGIEQAMFYFSWLTADGVGWLASAFAAVGCAALVQRNRQQAIIFASFPLAYCALMFMQRANFTRNMVVIIPYMAVLAAYAFSLLAPPKRGSSLDATLRSLIAICLLALPCARSAVIIRDAMWRGDSRDALFVWFTTARQPLEDVAVAGQLQIPWEILNLPGVDSFDISKTPLENLGMQGYGHIIIPSSYSSPLPTSYEVEWRSAGDERPQRFPQNPAITIVKPLRSAMVNNTDVVTFTREGERLIPSCAPSREEHCWIQAIATPARIPGSSASGTLKVMSPWRGQRLQITTSNGDEILSTPLDETNEWTDVPIPPLASRGGDTEVLIRITQVHSPASQGTGKDTRRLGIAIHR